MYFFSGSARNLSTDFRFHQELILIVALGNGAIALRRSNSRVSPTSKPHRQKSHKEETEASLQIKSHLFFSFLFYVSISIHFMTIYAREIPIYYSHRHSK
eukprot:TRINITY_DN6456_c0_g1_i6.p1 TRINITY_DN6456_c0_g1~~TRINITY_DN6456_c0_g1_i6.p1  ORF type:complete len:100 (+),score=14.63 TRINITY_DN6456_c0_g1_i6:1610-1909(+)